MSRERDQVALRFRCEDGSTYRATLDDDAPVRLVGGETIAAWQLVVGDEVESHYSVETGGTGHLVVDYV